LDYSETETAGRLASIISGLRGSVIFLWPYNNMNMESFQSLMVKIRAAGVTNFIAVDGFRDPLTVLEMAAKVSRTQ
jgi:hypothetical protein